MDHGYEAAFRQMHAEWYNVRRDTPEDEQRLRKAVDGHPRYRQIRDNEAKERARQAAYGRAYEQGVPIDPVDDSNFEKLWSGELKPHPDRPHLDFGYSQQDFQRNVETCQQDYARIADGSLTPRELLGPGVSRQAALDAIQAQIDLYEHALSTRGRSFPVNVAAMEKMRN